MDASSQFLVRRCDLARPALAATAAIRPSYRSGRVRGRPTGIFTYAPSPGDSAQLPARSVNRSKPGGCASLNSNGPGQRCIAAQRHEWGPQRHDPALRLCPGAQSPRHHGSHTPSLREDAVDHTIGSQIAAHLRSCESSRPVPSPSQNATSNPTRTVRGRSGVTWLRDSRPNGLPKAKRLPRPSKRLSTSTDMPSRPRPILAPIWLSK